MVWGLVDHFVDDVIQVYRSRERAERALRAVLADEPEWAGMIEVVPVVTRCDRHWRPRGKPVLRPACRRVA